MAIPLQIFNRNQGNIREAAGKLREAQAEVARVEVMLQSQLAAVFERYENARKQVEKYRTEMKPKIDRSLAQLEQQSKADGGYISPLEFLYFRQTYRTVTLTYFDALRELWESSVLIEGMVLADSVQAGPSLIPSVGIGPGGMPLRGTPLSFQESK